MKKRKTLTKILAFVLCIQFLPLKIFAAENTFITGNLEKLGFILVKQQYLSDKNSTAYYLKHKKSGACVFYLDDGKDEKTFSIGFRTPPEDNKGANHVLEHSLMCGSKKYPSKNLAHYLRSNSVATEINAVTNDDSTNYYFKTSNKKDFYNLADVYINAALNPSILNDEKIFKQQGIRKEYSDGKVVYNGVVYNEMRLRSFQTKDNAVDFVADKMYASLFGNTVPAFNSGGNVESIPNLTYSDILNVYKKYYNPSNSLICISGNQDISRTLSLLNSYLKNYNDSTQNITWNYSAVKPRSLVHSYNITNETKKVDIGFLFSGPSAAKTREAYAYEVLLYAVQKKIRTTYPKVYIVPAKTGGISNFGIIVSEVPINEKNKVISMLKSLEQDSITSDELTTAIDEVENTLSSSYFVTETSDLALNGFVYGSNPFLFLNQADDFKYLRDNPSYFKETLNRYIIDNPYKSIVVSGPVTKAKENNEIKVSSKELIQIKKETEDFNAWAEAKDTPETLAKLPVLLLDDFREGNLEKKEGQNEKLEKLDGVKYYATLNDSIKTAEACMYFQLPYFDEDLRYAAIMTEYLNYKFSSTDIENIRFNLVPCESFFDKNSINPRFTISFSYDKKNIEKNTKKIIKLLSDNELFSVKELEKFLEEENKKSKEISSELYRIESDIMLSSQSKADKFYTYTLSSGYLGKGSIFYYNFIKEVLQTPNKNNEHLSKLINIFKDTINKNNLIISYYGSSEEYHTVKKVFHPFISNMSEKSTAAYSKTPELNYNSAVILSEEESVEDISQIGNICKTGYKYSGKMNVLGNVLTSKYLTPILRGKMGAYGAYVDLDNSNVTFCTYGIDDIDKALKVFAGCGDYLRNLSMTQKELDSIIIRTLMEFDERYNSNYYRFENEALEHYTLEDLKTIRQEILNTTVDDIKNYADFIDILTAQKSIFVITNSENANKISLPFECIVDPSSLTIRPHLNENTK